MAFIVETGAGTPGANSYVPIAFVTSYLTDRGRETEGSWSTSTTAAQQSAAIAATDYIEKRWGPVFRGTALRPAITGRAAKGSVTLTTNALDTEDLTIGLVVYRLVATLAQENDVLIGATVAETVENIVAAVMGGDGSGTTYHEDTRPNFEATAAVDEDDTSILRVAAWIEGENGNSIALATTITGATASGATLAGGIDTTSQPLSFPRAHLFTPKGEPVVGIPLPLKQATAEYAVRAIAATLTPDPDVDSSLIPVQRKRDKVGPIEEEREYVAGAVARVFKPYPAADALLTDYVLSGSRTFR